MKEARLFKGFVELLEVVDTSAISDPVQEGGVRAREASINHVSKIMN